MSVLAPLSQTWAVQSWPSYRNNPLKNLWVFFFIHPLLIQSQNVFQQSSFSFLKVLYIENLTADMQNVCYCIKSWLKKTNMTIFMGSEIFLLRYISVHIGKAINNLNGVKINVTSPSSQCWVIMPWWNSHSKLQCDFFFFSIFIISVFLC